MTKLTVYGTGRICLEDEGSFKNFSSMDSAFQYIWSRRDCRDQDLLQVLAANRTDHWTDHKCKALIREIKEINGVDDDEL